MPRRLLPVLLVLATLLGLTLGPTPIVAQQTPAPGAAQHDPPQAGTKTVNVELILDASRSMAEALPSGETRIAAAKRILRQVIAGLPERSGLKVGLGVYGHLGDNTEAGKAVSCRSSEPLVPLAGLDKAALIAQVEAIQPTGWTPIAPATGPPATTYSSATSPPIYPDHDKEKAMDTRWFDPMRLRIVRDRASRRALARALAGGAFASLGAVPGTGHATAVAQDEESVETEHPAITALAAVLRDAAEELDVSVTEIAVLSLEAREWPDGCLGLPADVCTDVITPGYRIVLGPPAEGVVYRTDQHGAVRREPVGMEGGSLRVHYELTGGFAGLHEELELDTAALPPAEAAELRRLLEQADFWNLPEELDNGGYIDDGFEYVVTVAEGNRRHTVATYDGVGGAETRYPGFWALLEWLSQRAWDEVLASPD